MHDSFNLINAVDSIDRSICLVRGAANAFWCALDCFPIPKDTADRQTLDTFQTTATTLVETICDLLRSTSDNLGEYAKSISKTPKEGSCPNA